MTKKHFETKLYADKHLRARKGKNFTMLLTGFVLVYPEFNFLALLCNSQLVWLRLVGIFKH